MSFPELAKRALNVVPQLPQEMGNLMSRDEVRTYYERWTWAVNQSSGLYSRSCKHSPNMEKEYQLPALRVEGVTEHRLVKEWLKTTLEHRSESGTCCSIMRDGNEYTVRYGKTLRVVYRESGKIDINPADYDRGSVAGCYSPLFGLSLARSNGTQIQVHGDGSVYTWGEGVPGRLFQA